MNTKVEELRKIVEQRKIVVTGGEDQITWGNKKEGNFNLKEAKGIVLELDPQVPDKILLNLWGS